jgi:hypothetical protein
VVAFAHNRLRNAGQNARDVTQNKTKDELDEREKNLRRREALITELGGMPSADLPTRDGTSTHAEV